jgi:TOBE domain
MMASTGVPVGRPNVFAGVIEDIIPLGAVTRCLVRADGARFTSEQPRRTIRTGLAKGSAVMLHFESDEVLVMPRHDGTFAVRTKEPQ